MGPLIRSLDMLNSSFPRDGCKFVQIRCSAKVFQFYAPNPLHFQENTTFLYKSLMDIKTETCNKSIGLPFSIKGTCQQNCFIVKNNIFLDFTGHTIAQIIAETFTDQLDATIVRDSLEIQPQVVY